MNALIPSNLINDVFFCTAENFTEIALKVFQFQYQYNKVYKAYCDVLKINPLTITTIETIPFLPIQFYKNKKIITTDFYPNVIFESSGTTGSINSKHLVKDVAVYEQSFTTSFRQFYGDEKKLCIIGLLPSYLERTGSSLVFMVDDLIKKSDHKDSGFYLYNHEKLKEVLLKNEK